MAGVAAFAPPWIALGYGAFSYPVTGAGEAANVVIDGSTVYASRAEQGLEVLDAADGRQLAVVPPPRGSESVDDLAIADQLLFVLDARPPGHLSVFSLADAASPRLASPPVEVAVGPFSGVSAAGGRVVVSGGTSLLSLRSYDRRGRVGDELATIDLGRGQPDVLLAPDGRRAFVSTHLWGPHFGLTTVETDAHPAPLAKRGSLGLDTHGFTAGGAKPANFPVEAALAGSFLLVAHVRGVAVVSVERFERPELLKVLDVGVEAVNVDVHGGVAAVVGSSPEPRLVLLDVRTPASATIARSIRLPEGTTRATGVAIGPTRIAVAAHQKGVLLFPR